MNARTLVAGVGNVFFGDDGFGVEVARRLTALQWPADVKVADFGIRGMHLAYEIMSGYERVILIDATPRGNEPGTVYVIEPDTTTVSAAADAHSMALTGVFGFMRTLGGVEPHIIIVGCEPASVEERMGLSESVERAVETAVLKIQNILDGQTVHI
ncbi:MAG: hydrogenase maturation protease [Candidatus Eremiobacteraeota bacterium]|nr:hydrogenase maturation protease [Candidatus Eremiobacteraeota bacterium]